MGCDNLLNSVSRSLIYKSGRYIPNDVNIDKAISMHLFYIILPSDWIISQRLTEYHIWTKRWCSKSHADFYFFIIEGILCLPSEM